MELTQYQIAEIVDKHGLKFRLAFADGLLEALTLAAKQRQAAESVTPNRKGQWFVDERDARHWYGPVTGKDGDGDWCGDNCYAGYNWWQTEDRIQEGIYLRIPPPPEGVDVTGMECRKPVKGERWYSSDGTLADPICTPWDDDDYGMNRWIEQPLLAARAVQGVPAQ